MREKILDMLAACGKTERAAITDDMRLVDDLGIDSLTLLQLVMELEEKTGRRFDDDRLNKVRTVGDVIELVQK